jgi:hypothetical protein
MGDSNTAGMAKPSSSVKLVLLGEAAVGKVSLPGSGCGTWMEKMRDRVVIEANVCGW